MMRSLYGAVGPDGLWIHAAFQAGDRFAEIRMPVEPGTIRRPSPQLARFMWRECVAILRGRRETLH